MRTKIKWCILTTRVWSRDGSVETINPACWWTYAWQLTWPMAPAQTKEMSRASSWDTTLNQTSSSGKITTSLPLNNNAESVLGATSHIIFGVHEYGVVISHAATWRIAIQRHNVKEIRYWGQYVHDNVMVRSVANARLNKGVRLVTVAESTVSLFYKTS